jgi:hypothetical protein
MMLVTYSKIGLSPNTCRQILITFYAALDTQDF